MCSLCAVVGACRSRKCKVPCFHPMAAFRDRKSGAVFFYERTGYDFEELRLSCGQCVGCRLERSRQWAVRIMHEASLSESNCFITLTYDDAHLPHGLSLHYRDFQLFMKRLRKKYQDVRFYMCGEYGEKLGRPHFHACLFNCDFPDKQYLQGVGEFKLYTSKELTKLWGKGSEECQLIGGLTFESAAYVARYIMKKLTGDGEDVYYNMFDPTTGEIILRKKEFSRMSLKPGIGANWLRLYWKDVAGGQVVVNGKECSLPRYYRKYFKNSDYKVDQDERLAILSYEYKDDNMQPRLLVREEVVKSRLNLLQRKGML